MASPTRLPDLCPPPLCVVVRVFRETIHRGQFARLIRHSMHSLRILVGRFCSDRFTTKLCAPPCARLRLFHGFPSDELVLRPPVLLQESGGRPVMVVLGGRARATEGPEAFHSLGSSRIPLTFPRSTSWRKMNKKLHMSCVYVCLCFSSAFLCLQLSI